MRLILYYGKTAARSLRDRTKSSWPNKNWCNKNTPNIVLCSGTSNHNLHKTAGTYRWKTQLTPWQSSISSILIPTGSWFVVRIICEPQGISVMPPWIPDKVNFIQQKDLSFWELWWATTAKCILALQLHCFIFFARILHPCKKWRWPCIQFVQNLRKLKDEESHRKLITLHKRMFFGDFLTN